MPTIPLLRDVALHTSHLWEGKSGNIIYRIKSIGFAEKKILTQYL